MPLAGIWYSNNPAVANTGYGTQSRQLLTRMHADGHQVAVLANFGLEGAAMEWNGFPVYPRGFDQWSNDMVGPVYTDWTSRFPDLPKAIFGLFDAWVMAAPILNEVPVVWWTPIDHTPAPPPVLEKIRRPNWTPVAMSKHGFQMMSEAGIDRAVYAPHGIDTDLYRHTASIEDTGQTLTGRYMMGLPDGDDRFVVASFDANKASGGVHRKAWAERALAFAIFASGKDDVVWYIHSETAGAMGGWDFRQLLAACGVPPEKVKFSNQWAMRIGIPDHAIACMYSAVADNGVVLMPSMGEGFGLVAGESQSVGARVILTNCTAQTELCGPDSYLVNGQPFYNPGQAAWWVTPNVREIVDALEAAYAAPRGPSKANRRHIQDNYDANKVYRENWRPLLLRLAEEIAP